ncbi:MAG: sporulation protein YhbH [Dehalococcoidales bacterium]|nr:sporulation protein YhbH [Dehalococcoidales bacterium]
MTPQFSISKDDWSLHRKGPADQARHKEKVKEAIKNNLADIVSEESIITSDGNKIVKVPIRSLNLPHFRFDYDKKDFVGQGSGDSQVGDEVGDAVVPGDKGKGAGDQPGADYYEAEITVDELAEMIFADLGLPNLQRKESQEITSEAVKFDEISKKGIMSNLDKRRTVIEGIKRQALHGRAAFAGLRSEDLRFRTWTTDVRPESNAVVIAMRDVSASMGEFEKYISRSFYYWMVKFLRTKYSNVKIVFIAHHTEAKEVDEETFFHLGESGGTKVSSAYNLALEIIAQRFDPARWNIYPFHFSDGDNWGDDNKTAIKLVNDLVDLSSIFGYGEIRQGGGGYASSTLMAEFKANIRSDRFVGVMIGDKKDVYPALRRFFSTKEGKIDG